MKSVWKYPLPLAERQIVEMQANAKIVFVGTQGDQICIWALVDTEQVKEPRTFVIFGTGHQISTSARALEYISTVQQSIFVWHIFEEIE